MSKCSQCLPRSSIDVDPVGGLVLVCVLVYLLLKLEVVPDKEPLPIPITGLIVAQDEK